MNSKLSIDCTLSDSNLKIREYLLYKLFPILINNRSIVFVCIGSDRSTGDCLGPLIGYKLKKLSTSLNVYGSLDSPVHAKNIKSIINEIYCTYNNPFIIAIDSCLSSINDVGKIIIEDKPLIPGLALNKNLPSIGDMSIKGIVNLNGNFEFLILQNTRLFTVMSLADTISRGIYDFSLHINDYSNFVNNNSKDSFI